MESEDEPDFQREDSPTFLKEEKHVVMNHLSQIMEEEEVDLTNVTQNKTTYMEDINETNDESKMQLMDFVSDQPVAGVKIDEYSSKQWTKTDSSKKITVTDSSKQQTIADSSKKLLVT